MEMFPVEFSTDTDPKGRNEKGLAYLVMVLSEPIQKITATVMVGDSGLSVPCYTTFYYKMLPKPSTLKS